MNEQEFWTKRYEEAQTGWDIGYPSTPLKEYIDQLNNKELSILIPGAGNAYEAEYLWKNGFKNIYILDISAFPLNKFQQRISDFPKSHLIQGDFFQHKGKYDLIIEQTFFCSFVPLDETRAAYAKQMASLLNEGGKLAGVWFDIPLTGDMEKRPFGGDKDSYLKFLSPYFNVHTFEKCYNSIKPRSGNELFGIFTKK